jgi:pyruvate dehydrogenase E2 component (dihydrolipoamide acetyltransferase)
MPIFGGPRVGTPVHEYEGDERIPLRGIRKIIAERMVESKHIVPHFAYFDEVDLSELVNLRKELKSEAAEQGVKLTYLPFFLKAISLAIPKFPAVNASLDLGTQEVVYHQVQHIGMAVATENGLLVPVVRDVAQKSILQIAQEVEDLANRTREGTIKSEELKGSTITVSNIGSIGGLFATPIINYPEVAILGMTRLQERAVVRKSQIVVRHMMNLAWCFDHRIVDGAVGAHFSNEVIRYLENPSRMLLGTR